MAFVPYRDADGHELSSAEDTGSAYSEHIDDKSPFAPSDHGHVVGRIHLSSSSTWNPKSWSRRRRRTATIAAIICSIIALLAFSMLQFGPSRRRLGQIAHKLPSKAVVAASWSRQKGQGAWMSEIPEEWDVIRYVMDSRLAKYHPPVNSGREAMAYLTYIIDHYHDLPDYMVFIHGHNWSYHQPEPFVWKLESLNLTALDEEGYISLRCIHQPTCNVTHPKIDYTAPFTRLDKAGRMLPAFWMWADFGMPVPDQLSWPSGAQFAVSKAAILRRPLNWWKRYREPMLTTEEIMDYEWGPGFYWGLIHERLWHVVFGKPPVYCPDEVYCTKVLWSNGVLCDRYPVPPLVNEIMPMENITAGTRCFRNTNGTDDWELKPYSLCNITEYRKLWDAQCPWGDRWAQP